MRAVEVKPGAVPGFALAPWIWGLPGALCISWIATRLIVIQQSRIQLPSPFGQTILHSANIAFFGGVVLYLLLYGWHRRRARHDSADPPLLFSAFLSSFEIGILLLPLVAYLAVWRTRDHELSWPMYGFLNKRWLVASYWGACFITVFLPSALCRCFQIVRAYSARTTEPEPDGAVAHEASGSGEVQRSALGGFCRTAAKVLLALGLAAYFTGPPWHVPLRHRGIDHHEQVHLGPLQAIEKGHTPYLGPASIQYGPGQQLFTYAYMKLSGKFDMVGYRESLGLTHCVTYFVIACVALLTLEVPSALAVIFLAMLHSPLLLYYWYDDRTLDGYWGWGNGLRYGGALVLTLAFAPLLRATTRRRLLLGGLCLGYIWGAFCWFSQENLSGGLVATGLLAVLLWATRSTSIRQLILAATTIGAGFLLFWLPVLGYYASHHATLEFLHCYFLVPGCVVRGFSNTPWWEPRNFETLAFYFTPLVLIVLSVLCLYDFRRGCLRGPLSTRGRVFVASLCLGFTCYSTALFRSDSTHMLNTTIALPFILLLALTEVPRLFAKRFLLRAGMALCLMVPITYLFLYPLYEKRLYDTNWLMNWFTAPAARYAIHDPHLSRWAGLAVPYSRAGLSLTHEPIACPGGIPMEDFLVEMAELRAEVGDRRAYVYGFPTVYPELVYFLADLTPADFVYSSSTMVCSTDQRERFIKHFSTIAPQVECIITTDINIPEVAAFRLHHPQSTTSEKKLKVKGHPYFVITTDPPRSPTTASASGQASETLAHAQTPSSP